MTVTGTPDRAASAAPSTRLVASPFLAQHLLLQPGRAVGVRIPGIRYEELRAASHVGGYLPAWLVDAARQAWGIRGHRVRDRAAAAAGNGWHPLRTVVYEWDGATPGRPRYTPALVLEPGVSSGPITEILLAQ